MILSLTGSHAVELRENGSHEAMARASCHEAGGVVLIIIFSGCEYFLTILISLSFLGCKIN
jgi:hypothetical protein